MKRVYDFSKGERGKFYHPYAIFNFPIYLEPDVDEFLTKLAETKNMGVQALVNDWLRANIKLAQTLQ